MEALYDIALSLALAAAVVSLFAIMRLAFRSPSAPSWATGIIPANIAALMMTYAVAGSLFYLAVALSSAVPGWVAFFAAFAVHIGLVAVFLKLLPIVEGETAPVQRAQQAPSQGAAA